MFGISVGLVLSVTWASVREDRCRSLLNVAPDAVCAGVRVLMGLYTADDGYLQDLLSRWRTARWRPGGPGSSGQYRKGQADD
jgi:hypothetical protein